MPAARNISFLASDAVIAQDAQARLSARYGQHDPVEADVIVALGGDGFMLSTLHGTQELEAPVYGMNRGTVGFLMNEYAEDGLIERLEAAEEAVINPLHMRATTTAGEAAELLGISASGAAFQAKVIEASVRQGKRSRQQIMGGLRARIGP
mgnify:CR=1 FL=1